MAEFWEERPQELCKMCGKCCRVATASASYEELLELLELGNESAKEFLDLFEPYPSIDAARAADLKTVDNIIKKYIEDNQGEADDITFYKCKYILDNNLCGIYEKRPTVCDRFPSSQWAVVPPGCGFKGYLYDKALETVYAVQKQKKQLAELESELNKSTDSNHQQEINVKMQELKDSISLYEKYGANEW